MHFLPSKKIVWFVIGVIAVEGLFIFSSKNDGLLSKRTAPKPEVAAERAADTPVFAKDPNTSEKTIAKVAPTDNVLNYLSQIGRSLAEGSRQIAMPEPSYEPPAARFTANDLSIIPPTDEDIAVYIVRTLLVLEAYPSFRDTDPLATIGQWLESEDPTLADEIRRQSNGHVKTAEALSRVPVPRSFVGTHLTLMNNIYRSGIALEDVLQTTANPGTGLLAAAHYTSYRTKRAETIIALTKEFNERQQ